MHTVFVYGTLKKGQSNHGLLEKSEFIGPAFTHGSSWKMYHLGAFPAIVPTNDFAPPIAGELYEVDDATFKRLDYLEGYPNFYGRVETDIYLPNGTFAKMAWVYFMEESGRNTRLIESGEW